MLLLPELAPFVQTEKTFGHVQITDEVSVCALNPSHRFLVLVYLDEELKVVVIARAGSDGGRSRASVAL